MSKLQTPQATSSLLVWLDYLNSIHTSAIELGLDRIQVVASQANLIKPAPKVITVAGTNGKGSTCALIESILIDAGYHVGVYSSPHLIHYTERVRINGKELSDQEHIDAFVKIEHYRSDVSLSFFEFSTLSALQLFKTNNVDVVVLEVGLGGRLDATNVVDHDVSVITSLAIDHVDWLGDDINVIGYEKAGIFRPNKPAICGQPNPPASVAAHADDINANFYQVGIQFQYQVNKSSWCWNCAAFELSDLPIPSLPLPNAATALMALGSLDLEISDINIVNGLKNAHLPGRMQIISTDPDILLDVAHNPHAAKYLSQQLQKKYGDKRIHAVIGMLHDKDIKETIANLVPVITHWYPCSLSGPRAAKASELTCYLSDNVSEFDCPVSAFKAALTQAQEMDVIVVIGSFYTVGEVLEYWQNKESKA